MSFKLPSADEFARRIIAVGTDFVGLVETLNNAHWDDPRTTWRDTDKDVWLRSWMRKVPGWTPSAAYCAAFAGVIPAAVLHSAGVPMKTLDQLWFKVWTAHCMTNVNTFDRLKLLCQTPVPGALWLAQHGTSQAGHAGIVQTVHKSQMTTVEGNTNDAGGREGDGIFIKSGSIAGRGKLRTKGFVHPSALLKLIAP